MPSSMLSLVLTEAQIETPPILQEEIRADLEKRLGYVFEESILLQTALSHRSWCAEYQGPSNERLEFLGDAVLGLVIASLTYDFFPEKPEGDLAKIRSGVVSAETLSQIAQGLFLGDAIFLGHGEEIGGGRGKKSILSDSLEAVIGAVFLEGGIEKASLVIRNLFFEKIKTAAVEPGVSDYKTRLQELAIQFSKTPPRYCLVADGPDHQKNFYATVYIENNEFGPAFGTSKKRAEQAAARLAYDFLEKMENGEKS